MVPASYPSRPAYFACRFVRLLFKVCAAGEVGGQGVALLTCVAMTEDARRYKSAPLFFCAQLEAAGGFGSRDSFERVRRACIDAGWLHYERGAPRRAGRYWVCIPAAAADFDDDVAGELATNEPQVIRTGADEQRMNSGNDDAGTAGDPHGCGHDADAVRIGRGFDADQTSALPPSPLPRPSPPPLPDDGYAALLTPVKHPVPRGTQNDTPHPATTITPEQCPEAALGLMVRWRVNDPTRTEENRLGLRAAAARYGLPRVLATAERLMLAGAPQRPAGHKCWPDELLPALIAEDAASAPAQPAVATIQVPAVVLAARDLIARHGDAACREALGWAPTVAPTHDALLAAFDREAAAQALIDHFTVTPAGAAP